MFPAMLGPIAGSLIGSAANIGLGLLNNDAAAERTARDRRENYEYNEKAADNADARTRALYKDIYSPSALLKQYNEAGLSPSMMFGGTPGQGGMSGAQGAGTQGAQTPFMPLSMIEGAQVAKLIAETDKTKAETKTIEGTREASIKNILADTGLKEASTAVQKAEEAGIALDNYVKENTKEASIYRICEEAEEAGNKAQLAFEELQSAKVLADVNQATYREQIEMKTLAVQQLAASIAQSKAMTKLTNAQRDQVQNAISQAWADLDLRWSQLDIEQQQADTYTKWINEQIPIIEKQLDVKLQELGIEKKRMVLDAITGTIKSLAFGAMAAASFKGGQGSIQTNPSVLKPKYSSKQATKDRGKNIYEANEIYSW